MTYTNPDFPVNSWARLVDTEVIGKVRGAGSAPTPWVKLVTEAGQAFTVPPTLLTPCEDPEVEKIAFEILDFLSEVDRSWSIIDSLCTRRALVKLVLARSEAYRAKGERVS